MTNVLSFPRAAVAALALATALTCVAHRGEAQSVTSGVIRGTVVDAVGRPIENADVVVEQLKRRTRTTTEGFFLFTDVKPGKYTIGVRSIGYESASAKITVRDSAAIVRFALGRAAFSLPARVTTASRGGLSGVIADTGYAPLADVRVRVIGADEEGVTDARGAFFLPVKPGRYLVRIERDGYARQLIGVSVPETEGREIAAWMIPQKGKDNPQVGANLFDMRKRMIGAVGPTERSGPASARYFSREEIDKLGHRDVLTLIRAAAGYPVGPDCWVTINGGPRKDPIWRLSTDEVEFVEVYERNVRRVTGGPQTGSRERLAEQRLEQATTPTGLCAVNIIVWTR